MPQNRSIYTTGRITSNTNKVPDSRYETLWYQSIALVKIILKAEMEIFICCFIMYYPFIEIEKQRKSGVPFLCSIISSWCDTVNNIPGNALSICVYRSLYWFCSSKVDIRCIFNVIFLKIFQVWNQFHVIHNHNY